MLSINKILANAKNIECVSYKTRVTDFETLVAGTMHDWNCSYIEALASVEYDCHTLSDTRTAIMEAVSYNRLLVSLLPEMLDYLKNEYYRSRSVTEEFIQKKAQRLVTEEAEMIVYQWHQIDDYDTITEPEKETAVYGSDDILSH